MGELSSIDNEHLSGDAIRERRGEKHDGQHGRMSRTMIAHASSSHHRVYSEGA
jgi:hypothetical protein